MGTIRVTPEMLHERANMLEKCAYEFRINLHTAQTLGENVLLEWEDAEMDSYYARIQQLSPGCEDMAAVLQNLAESLRRAAMALETSEQSAACQIVKGLFG